VSEIFHAAGVFFDRLASVHWGWLGLAVCCHLLRLACVSRAWRNIVQASYPDANVPWRSFFGAIAAAVGVNAIIPARGGDLVRLFIAKHRVEGSTYPTLGATLVVLTMFDFVVAGCLMIWALFLGVLPGTNALKRLHMFDFGWVLHHPGRAFVVVGVVFLIALMIFLWFVEQIQDFWAHVRQGFAVLADRRAYLRNVALWQAGDWTLRIVAIFWFLKAFGLPATVHNALLVQVSQSLATTLPLSPSGIGTEQAFLLYLFRGKAARAVLLSFSVGMRITLMIVNVIVGFTAILIMLGTLRWRERVEAAAP
jgi:uncharacterized membrane protein YbhN (UPF0104 family)